MDVVPFYALKSGVCQLFSVINLSVNEEVLYKVITPIKCSDLMETRIEVFVYEKEFDGERHWVVSDGDLVTASASRILGEEANRLTDHALRMLNRREIFSAVERHDDTIFIPLKSVYGIEDDVMNMALFIYEFFAYIRIVGGE